MTKHRLICWISAIVVLLGSASAFSQTPRLTRSSLQHDPTLGDYVNLTIHGHRHDYCVLFFSLSKREQRVDLPPALGGQVTLGLGAMAIYASTVDGRIRFDKDGKWTHQLVFPPILRDLLRNLELDMSIHFQAVSFRGAGPVLSRYVSNVLDLPLHETPPKTRLGTALDLLRKQDRGARFGRRPMVAEPVRGFDLFGNRILRRRLR